MQNTFDTIIVGAGVAGILAGILAAKKGQKTLLIDSQKQAGGLLRTYEINDALHFDYGTHLLMQTGIDELDEILFKDVDSNWYHYDFLNSGHYVNGMLDETSPVLNAHSLGKSLHDQGAYELIANIGHKTSDPQNCAEQLLQRFGSTFFNQLFKPSIEKLFHTPIDSLTPNAQVLFGLNRVKAFDPITSRSLKEHAELSDILAFHSHEEGKSGKLSFYPKQGGIGQWVDLLIEQYKSYGGTLLLGNAIEKVNIENGSIESVHVDGDDIQANNIIWTTAVFPLIKSQNLRPNMKKVELLDSHLVHLLVDSPPLTSMFYFCNYAPDFDQFRTTLYSNLQKTQHEASHRVTVEVFGKGNELSANYSDKVLDELIRCGVFPDDTTLLYSQVMTAKSSFPIYSQEFEKQRIKQIQAVRNSIDNIQLFGKARGDIFFMNDVLTDVYNNIKL